MLKINFVEEDIKKLHYERYHHPHPLVQKKMEAIYLKSQGVTHKDICRLCQISKTTLTKYIRQYQTGRVEELTKIEYKGQTSKLNQYSRQIEEYFKIHPASSVAAASDVIEKITGIKRSPTQIREFMKRIGLRCLKVGYVPGKSLEPERIKEVEVYKIEKLEPLLEQAIKGEKAVYFVDAAHFVHRAYLGFLWCFVRTFICSPSGRRRFNVLGAINAVTKEIITVTNETYINAESVCELLIKIADLGLSIPSVLILDNARYQKCKLVSEKAEALGIELCYLPAYSPQLNLIERLWKFVRNECLYSKYYENFADFKAEISTCIGTANTDRKEKLDSLLTLNFQSFAKVQILTV
ncbi:IS630 family transposase [Chamaesiphon sp.]|uniref:IS630 family transposase n=1 Tax=Chamaesiphon sp. TaxID=2814140 RepID=UPI0035935635